jgi:hypothetical protein
MSRKEKTINLGTFRNMKTIFNEDIKPNLGENYSDSVWQNLNDLKEYIAFIETQAKDKGINISGIRFHFAAQEENKQLTIALIPTFNDGKEHVDFDPVFSSEDGPKRINDIEVGSEYFEMNGSIMDRNIPIPENY